MWNKWDWQLSMNMMEHGDFAYATITHEFTKLQLMGMENEKKKTGGAVKICMKSVQKHALRVRKRRC